MRIKKHFALRKGKYYFHIKSGQSTMLIYRIEKEEAENAYLSYKKVGKNVEWLGKWGGKKFSENIAPVLAD